jgi:hypothetical protein
MKARIRELLRVTPFQPFIIRMADGQEYRIEHPDFILASPNDRTYIFIEQPNDRVHQLSPLLITSIESVSDFGVAVPK